MKRSRSETKRLGPAAAAMRRRDVYHDQRTADSQLSVEKILSDAVAMQKFHAAPRTTGSTRVVIQTTEELALYRQRTRAEMEEKLRRGANALGNWTKYARWEAVQKDFVRMRTVMERCVSFHDRNPKFWRDYAELEMENGFTSHAREVWNRAVTTLPASADLWLKYLLFEQTCEPAPAAALASSSSSAPAAATQTTGSRTRDLFSRLLAGPVQPAPEWAYELYALYEVRCGRVEACREVLSRYVKETNEPGTWLLYSDVEKNVLQDSGRATRVLETAMKALPDALVWGMTECRIPLALADLYRESGQLDQGRQVFTDLLQHLQEAVQQVSQAVARVDEDTKGKSRQPSAVMLNPTSALDARVEEVLNEYSRFERLCAGQRSRRAAGHAEDDDKARTNLADTDELTTYSDIAHIQARRAFEARLAKNPSDFDAHVSLYLSLREAYRHASPGTSAEVCAQRLAAARQQLARAVAVKPASAYAAQQWAVLVMEYARQECLAGQAERAREMLARGIRSFPFEEASCPRLWLEAAALEEQLGHWDQARRLLQSATHVTKDASLFDAALLLEDRALRAAQDSGDAAAAHQTFLTNARRLYQDAIKAFPADEFRWFSFARLEEAESQEARASAVLMGCIQSLTAAATKAPSFAQRHAFLGKVDAAWGKQLALAIRLWKRRTRKAASSSSSPSAEEDAAEAEVFRVFDRFLRAVWTDYRFEAFTWRTTFVAKEEAAAIEAAHAAAATAAKQARYKQNNTTNRTRPDQAPTAAPTAPAPAATRPAPVQIPETLPTLLGPAVARWKAAVDAVVARAVQGLAKTSSGPTSSDPTPARSVRLGRVRAIFRQLLEDERQVVRRSLLGHDADAASYDASQIAQRWSNLILAPLTNAWASFETAYGGSTESVQQAAPPSGKRRTRLFRAKTE